MLKTRVGPHYLGIVAPWVLICRCVVSHERCLTTSVARIGGAEDVLAYTGNLAVVEIAPSLNRA